jgi:hypothetical protein
MKRILERLADRLGGALGDWLAADGAGRSNFSALVAAACFERLAEKLRARDQ